MNKLIFGTKLAKVVVAGNVLFILWILYNGMDEGWKAKPVELASYIALIALLFCSSVLIATRNKI